jgi:hypothetical protein
MFNTQAFLRSLSKTLHRRLLYYPSAGERDGFVCNFNADIFVFSDYRPKSISDRRAFWKQFRQSCTPQKIRLIKATPVARVFQINRHKIGIFLFLDNNDAVEMIRRSGLKISIFFSKNDGCAEGGNYQCVNQMPFFGKILDLMPDNDEGMCVLTSHNGFLFSGTYSGKLAGEKNFRFVVGNNTFVSSPLADHVPWSDWRPSEIIIKKCQVSAGEKPMQVYERPIFKRKYR